MAVAKVWRTRGWAARALLPLSLLHGALTGLRRKLYRFGWMKTERVPVPVIVVGNVVAGGAGKTPAVISLVRHLQMRGLRVGVISRGHGRAGSDARAVELHSTPSDVGDEPLLIARRTNVPVVVGQRRIDAARLLLIRWPATDLILSDDGLQHLGLARDIEICVFDDRGIGNRWLLPAGPLREPWPRSVDLVLHTGANPAFGGFVSRRSLAEHAVGVDGSHTSFDELRAQRCVAVAGIASPSAFFDMLRERGIVLVACIALPDHYDFEGWASPARTGERLLCTEKDAIKLWAIVPKALAVPLVFEPEAAFFDAFDRSVDAKLSSRDGHQTA